MADTAGRVVAEEHLVVIEPLPKNHEENVAKVRREIDHRGLSVIVACRACDQMLKKVASKQESAGAAVSS